MSFSCPNDRDMIRLNRPHQWQSTYRYRIGTFRDTLTLTIFITLHKKLQIKT